MERRRSRNPQALSWLVACGPVFPVLWTTVETKRSVLRIYPADPLQNSLDRLLFVLCMKATHMFGHRLYLAILISTLFACIALRISSAREKESATRSISVSSIGSDIELIGRLGHPLGTMLSVDGNWEYPDQSNGPTKVYSI